MSRFIDIVGTPGVIYALTLLCRFCQYQAFLQIVQELNDFAGQREVVAENLLMRICVELAKYSQELKQERKSVKNLSLCKIPNMAVNQINRGTS